MAPAWRSPRAPAVRSTRTCQRRPDLEKPFRWRECPYYTDRERAALEWTEAITLITNGHDADAIYEAVRPHFSDKELADLTLAIAAINSWNRLSIAARTVPGTYQPAVATAHAKS
jgi:alkylhydroperoxidase family enzyme